MTAPTLAVPPATTRTALRPAAAPPRPTPQQRPPAQHRPPAQSREPNPRPAGFVLYVDVGPEAFSALPNEILTAAQTLHELVQEWLPDARTRMVLASGDRTTTTTAPDRGRSLRASLAAIPDVTPVQVDLRARRVTVGGEPVRLTTTEFDLLAALLRAQGRAVTREELHATVWRGRPVRESSRTVDVHVRRLRAIPALSELITTARGVGYCIPVRPHLHVTA